MRVHPLRSQFTILSLGDSMPPAPVQSAAAHKRYVPGFHYLGGGLLLVGLIWGIIRATQSPTAATLQALLLTVILTIVYWYARSFPIHVQDRIICLEERLRLATILPTDLRSRIVELTPSQLIALRFASDSELPSLTRQILTEGLEDQASIKARISTWRPDTMRI